MRGETDWPKNYLSSLDVHEQRQIRILVRLRISDFNQLNALILLGYTTNLHSTDLVIHKMGLNTILPHGHGDGSRGDEAIQQEIAESDADFFNKACPLIYVS